MWNKLLAAFAAFTHMTGSGILLAVQDLTPKQKVAAVALQSLGLALAGAWNIQLPRKEEKP